MVTPTNYGTAEVSSDGLTVTVSDLELGYPGDGCTIDLTIVNEGSLDAVLTSLEVQNADGSAYDNENADIKVTVPDMEGETLAANSTCSLSVAVVWDSESAAENASADFKIVFDYDQSATAAGTITPSHGEEHTANPAN